MATTAPTHPRSAARPGRRNVRRTLRLGVAVVALVSTVVAIPVRPVAAVPSPPGWDSARCLGRVAAANSGPYVVGHNCRTVTVGGLDRMYVVHIPSGVVRTDPHAVVVVFHGRGGSGGEFADRLSTGWEQLGDERQVITVYPSAAKVCLDIVTNCQVDSELRARWFADFWSYSINANRPPGFPVAATYPVDDLAFVDAIVGELNNTAVTNMAIDPGRIFAAGFSAGGCMATTVAFSRSTVFSGVASVSGCGSATPEIQPTRFVPVMYSIGTNDGVTLPGVNAAAVPPPDTNVLSMFPSAIVASPFGTSILAALASKSGLDIQQRNPATYPRVINGTALTQAQITYMGFSQPLPGKVRTKAMEVTVVNGAGHDYSPLPNVTPAQMAWDFFERRTR